jgi:nitroreductase
MKITEAIQKRISIRGFKPDPVSKETVREILETAGRAPSAMNVQPWEFTVITGDVLDRIRSGILEKLNCGAPAKPEHSVVGWPKDSIFRQRQVNLAKQIFSLMDIKRGDKEKRASWLERGFRFFDAPTAIVITTDSILAESTPLIDIGAVMQSICLAALDHGLGTCIEDQGVMYPDVLRKFAGIKESRRIVIAIAVGYPDPDFPANRLVATREPVDSITQWVGFQKTNK